MKHTITQLAAMLSLALLIALLLSMTACGQSDQSDSDMETKLRAADIDKLRAADIEMADGTIAAFPDIDEGPANVPLPSDMENHPLSRYFNGDGTEVLRYIGRFWFVCDTEHQAYIKAKCDDAVERGVRIGKQVGIRLTRADLVNPDYWEMVNQVRQMENNQDSECTRNFDGPSLKATYECGKARRERVNKLLAELSID